MPPPVPVLQGRQLLLVHVERASDILQVLALKREFPNLRIVIVGATEGWRVAPQLAAAHVPIIANALVDLPASFEQLGATQSNIGRMIAAGVQVSIGMLNDDEARQVRLSTQYAGNLVAIGRVPGHTGLSWDQAFAAISSGPAETMGMGGEIGSLRPGRRGDVVIWDGDPLELATGVDAVWIDGVRQDLDQPPDPPARPLPPAAGRRAAARLRSEDATASDRRRQSRAGDPRLRRHAPADVASAAAGARRAARRARLRGRLFAGLVRHARLDDLRLARRRSRPRRSGSRRSGGGRSPRR